MRSCIFRRWNLWVSARVKSAPMGSSRAMTRQWLPGVGSLRRAQSEACHPPLSGDCVGGRHGAPEVVDGAPLPALLDVSVQSAKTYSTVALRISFSSGVLTSFARAGVLRPEAMARYCLPLTSNVIGGAQKPVPTLTFHNSSSVVSS